MRRRLFARGRIAARRGRFGRSVFGLEWVDDARSCLHAMNSLRPFWAERPELGIVSSSRSSR